MKDPAGNTWSYTYDLRGRQTSATDPDRGTTRTGYDNAGQVTSTTDARGQTLVYVRDKLGRQTALRENSTTGTLRATWVYDTRAKGQLTSATRRNGADRYTVAVTGYDDGYRPLGQSVTIPSAETGLAGTYTTRYTYAPNGQQLTTQLPALGDLPAETVTYNYDALSRPLDSVGLRFLVANTRYDEYGRPVMIDMGASFSNRVYHDYDEPTGRVTNTSLNRFNTNMLEMSTAFTYDAAGNTLSAIDRPEGGFATDAQCFTYDGLRRLTEAWTPASEDCTTTPTAAGLGGPAPYWFRDTFDPVGNRTQRVATTRTTRVTTDYTYPAPGQPRAHAPSRATHTTAGGVVTTSTYAYDATGNTITRSPAGAPRQTLTWDPEGRLVTVASTAGTDTYLYTADGDRLVRRQKGTTTIYLPGGQELHRTSAGTVTATRYYTFAGKTVAVRTGSTDSGLFSVISNAHSTSETTIRNSDNGLIRRRLDPYGNLRRDQPASWPGDHGFLDKPTDTTGLTQIGARYYDASLGRFISVDPLMDLTDPQHWHGYSYANNNPITYSDPTGLAPLIDGMWGSTKAAAVSAKPPVQNPISVTKLYTSWVKGSLGAVGGAVKGLVGTSPVVMLTKIPQQVRSGVEFWRQVRSWDDYTAQVGANWSETWRGTRDALMDPWVRRDPYAAAEQLGGAGATVAMAAVPVGGLAGGATRLSRVVPSRPAIAANTAERTVAMGRNMTDRVIPYATRNGYDWYRGTPGWVPRSTIERISPRGLERTDLWFNQRWIRGEMRGGSRIVDIGEPAGYPPSVFYNMERQQVSGYWNYVQDIQP